MPDNNSVSEVFIRTTENGYVVTSGGHYGEGARHTWVFETMSALTKELPRIMALPYEKQKSPTVKGK